MSSARQLLPLATSSPPPTARVPTATVANASWEVGHLAQQQSLANVLRSTATSACDVVPAANCPSTYCDSGECKLGSWASSATTITRKCPPLDSYFRLRRRPRRQLP